jgi:hypothetical protein
MALDFNLLKTPDLGGQFVAGQEAVQNQLVKKQQMQMQQEQIAGQADARRAQAAENQAQAAARQAEMVEAQRRRQWLSSFGTKLAEGGKSLDEKTLGEMVSSGIPEVQQLGLKGLQEMAAEKKFQEAFSGAAPATPAAPSTIPADGAAPFGQPGQAPVRVQGSMTAGFDIPAAQAQINRLLTLRDPRATAAVNALQAQINAEQNRVKAVRDDERMRNRDDQAAADRAEARNLRLELAAGRRAGSGEGGGAGDAGKGTLTVRDESGKLTTVTKADAVRRGLVEVKSDDQMTPQEIQKREALYPKAKQAVQTVEATMDTLDKDLTTLANHPGLSGITGLVYGRTPGLTPQAREAEALYNKIVARGGFSELQAMRAASPTGGALGNVSNTEGQQLKQAFAEIGREQATGSVKAALLWAAESARQTKQRAREAYDDTYSYKTGQQPAAPAAPPAPPTMSDQDKQALAWANANSKDPRAAAIKQRLGVK